MKNILKALCVVSSFFLHACSKDYLDTKPSSNIIQPQTLTDMSNLLENSIIYSSTSALTFLSSDEYYYKNETNWNAAYTATERESYVWAKDIYGGDVAVKDWNMPYQAIFYANNVLSGLTTMNDSVGSAEYNLIKGWALFVRAYEYFNLLVNFSPSYDSTTENIDLGVPLKLTPDIDIVEQRSSMKACYDQIFSDLDEAALLLPSIYPTGHQNRASKIAIWGLLARINLYMRRYNRSLLYADSCLQAYNTLIDYNRLSLTSSYPFSTNNEESIYTTIAINSTYSAIQIGSKNQVISMDTSLLRLYDSNDLRFSIYFRNGNNDNTICKGGYFGIGLWPYTGIAVDEMYLIRAECFARSGQEQNALNDLNTLLSKRYKTGTFVDFTLKNTSNVLDKVLEERRKELIWRGLRWSDLKRLNKENANITLTRVLNGQVYTLPPNDPRYVFNIPADEIALSGITQNER